MNIEKLHPILVTLHNIRHEREWTISHKHTSKKATVDSRFDLGFYTARCRPPTTDSAPHLIITNKIKQHGVHGKHVGNFDYLIQHGVQCPRQYSQSQALFGPLCENMTTSE